MHTHLRERDGLGLVGDGVDALEALDAAAKGDGN
jgi:hypothetical protein